MSLKEQAELWRSRISEQQASGLTITRWCKDHELGYRQFHYWKKRLSNTDCINDKPIEFFAEVPSSSAKNSKAYVQKDKIRLSFHGVEIDVPESFHADTLLGLMKVLQQL